eukprot:Platyproteum_vivax@DN5435_c0_g1_i3.p1
MPPKKRPDKYARFFKTRMCRYTAAECPHRRCLFAHNPEELRPWRGTPNENPFRSETYPANVEAGPPGTWNHKSLMHPENYMYWDGYALDGYQMAQDWVPEYPLDAGNMMAMSAYYQSLHYPTHNSAVPHNRWSSDPNAMEVAPGQPIGHKQGPSKLGINFPIYPDGYYYPSDMDLRPGMGKESNNELPEATPGFNPNYLMETTSHLSPNMYTEQVAAGLYPHGAYSCPPPSFDSYDWTNHTAPPSPSKNWASKEAGRLLSDPNYFSSTYTEVAQLPGVRNLLQVPHRGGPLGGSVGSLMKYPHYGYIDDGEELAGASMNSRFSDQGVIPPAVMIPSWHNDPVWSPDAEVDVGEQCTKVKDAKTGRTGRIVWDDDGDQERQISAGGMTQSSLQTTMEAPLNIHVRHVSVGGPPVATYLPPIYPTDNQLNPLGMMQPMGGSPQMNTLRGTLKSSLGGTLGGSKMMESDATFEES